MANPSKEIAIATYEIPRAVSNVRDESGTTIGVSFTQESDTVCSQGTFSFTTRLLCDAAITGEAEVISVTQAGCVFTANIKHQEGCADIKVDIEKAMGWLEENEWALGVIYLVIGPIIALFGLRFFPLLTSGITGLFIMIITIYVAMAAGWMASTGGCIAVIVVAVNLGIVAGCIVKRYIWLLVGMIGLVAGFFAGSMIYAIIYGTTGWDKIWSYWLIAISLAVIGTWASCTMGKSVVLISTSLIGSYFFTQAWALFFPGHFPTESDIVDQDGDMNLEIDPVFWVFIGVFLSCFVFSLFF